MSYLVRDNFQIQMLHFIKQAGSGGENQFCDGFRVVDQLKREKPNVSLLLVEH